MNLSNILEKPFDSIGYFGPVILFFDAIYRLWGKQPYLLGYLATFGLNYPINLFLKKWIKQPRPEGGRSFLGETYKGADHYGMPSLHAQSTAITIAFLYMTNGFSIWTILELFVLSLVIYQRYMYKRHTLEQITVGTIIGFILGWIGCYITKNMIYRNSIA